MDVQTLTMDQAEAAKAFREYRAAFMAERNRIDGELMRGYKAIAQGKKLISLNEAIRSGGVDDLGRPRLAIGRADESVITMRLATDGRIEYAPDARVRRDDRLFVIPSGVIPAPPQGDDGKWWLQPWHTTWFARSPFIPPQYRPPHGLSNYHLLWEAEWRRQSGPQRRDPMLLKRIGGDVFAVLAAWDLTELEKLVLAR